MKCPKCKAELDAIMMESNFGQDIRLEGNTLSGEIINQICVIKSITCPGCGADLTKKVKWDPKQYGFLEKTK